MFIRFSQLLFSFFWIALFPREKLTWAMSPNHISFEWETQCFSMCFWSCFRKMTPKVFINDSVYKVFRMGISDVAKCLFGNGFEGIFGVHFGVFCPKWAPERKWPPCEFKKKICRRAAERGGSLDQGRRLHLQNCKTAKVQFSKPRIRRENLLARAAN